MEMERIDHFRVRLNKDGVKLLDKFIKVNRECGSALELMMTDLVAQFPARPVRFINFIDFVSLGRFPRYPDNADITCSLESIDRSCSLLVFISHCWLRGHPGTEGWDGKAHPDNINNEKYKLCVEGIKRTMVFHAPRMKNCFVWIDFGCMNQDDKENMSEELEHYDRIIQYCDCLFTPTVERFWDEGSFWDVHQNTFLSRAWCRIEMLYAAYLPILQDGDNSVKRHTLFDAGLAYHCSRNRRPHFVFDLNSLRHGHCPRNFPPLQFSYFDEYHPLNGKLSVASDIECIRKLIDELMPFIDKCRKSDESARHGNGVMVFENGCVFDGRWNNEKRCGHGLYRLASGEEYVGSRDAQKNGHGCVPFTLGTFNGYWKDDVSYGLGMYQFLDCGDQHGTFRHAGGLYDEDISRLGLRTHRWTDGVDEGELNDAAQHGQGSSRYADGDEYTEMKLSDKRDGLRTYRFANGDVFTGQLKDDARLCLGTLRYACGYEYTGEWIISRYGHGTHRFANGDVYEGEWINIIKHGLGIYRCANGDVYEGVWVNGRRHGHVNIRYANGDMFERWWNDQRCSLGTHQYANGDIYVGELTYDRRHGHGTHRYVNGGLYEGEWQEDKRSGRGTYRYANGDVYEGEWQEDERSGHGTHRYANGDVYEGKWRYDKRDRFGTQRYANGDVYVGEWSFDMRLGHGTYRYANGYVFEGAWKNDQQQGGKSVYQVGCPIT